MAIKPILSVPVSTIVRRGGSALLNSSVTQVVEIPSDSSGKSPAFVRVALSAGAAYVAISTAATSATATTGHTIVTANEALWMNCVGLKAIGGLQIGNTNAIMQVSPLEEGGGIGASTVNLVT